MATGNSIILFAFDQKLPRDFSYESIKFRIREPFGVVLAHTSSAFIWLQILVIYQYRHLLQFYRPVTGDKALPVPSVGGERKEHRK